MLNSHFSLQLARSSVEMSRAQMSARRRLDAAEARELQRKNAARATALAMVERGLGPPLTVLERDLEVVDGPGSERLTSINETGQEKPPFLNLTIDLGGGRTTEIEVRDGDSPDLLAAAFCEAHGLNDLAKADLKDFIVSSFADAASEQQADAQHGRCGPSDFGDASTAADDTATHIGSGAIQEAAWEAAAAAAERAAAARRRAKETAARPHDKCANTHLQGGHIRAPLRHAQHVRAGACHVISDNSEYSSACAFHVDD